MRRVWCVSIVGVAWFGSFPLRRAGDEPPDSGPRHPLGLGDPSGEFLYCSIEFAGEQRAYIALLSSAFSQHGNYRPCRVRLHNRRRTTEWLGGNHCRYLPVAHGSAPLAFNVRLVPPFGFQVAAGASCL